MQEEISVVVACKQTWQNMRAYQAITNIRADNNNYIGHNSILSAITHKLNVCGHMLIRIFFLILVCETRVQSLSAPFSYNLYMSKSWG
jgi:hypothetical protein